MEKDRYDVFLSYATADKPAVEELARFLVRQGLNPWLDKWNLIPGEPWQEAIENALASCTACVVCLGPSRTGPWQNEEMRVAITRRVDERNRGLRVIPVLLPGAERGEPSRYPAFLRATTWVEFHRTLDDEDALHRLVSGIRGVEPGPGPGGAVAAGACPYRGLEVFDVGDARFFFGREALTGWLLDKLRTDPTANRFLAVVGPSGSGKSSLARAGLLAALKRGEIPGSGDWPAAVCKPGAEPLQSLALALAKAFRLSDASTVLALSRDLLADPHALHVAAHLHLSLGDTPADRRLVVLMDQFEEVFTLCPNEAQRRAVISNLLYAASVAEGRTVVVLTLRADFYGRCAAYPDLAAAVSDRQSLVGPMTREELRSAIERPAYRAGCELDEGLADLLLNEVESQPGSLPLLEHALLQIWERREGGRRLTIDCYHEVGGVTGALEKHAEKVFSDFTDQEREVCRTIFLSLVQVDDQGRATKRRLGLEDLSVDEADWEIVEVIVSRLTDARLLTTDQDQHPTVELAHEALLKHWERLKQWIDQDREALQIRRRFEEAAAEWLRSGRDPSFLYRGARLAQAEEWSQNHLGEESALQRKFLKASINKKRWSMVQLAAAILAAVAVLFLIYGLLQRSLLQRQINLATWMAGQSKLILTSNPLVSLLLGTKAVQLKDDLPEAKSAMLGALARFDAQPLGKPGIVAIAAAADRRSIVTVAKDGTASLWSLGGEAPAAPVQTFQLQETVDALALSNDRNDRRWLLTRDQDGIVRLKGLHPGGKTIPLPDENWCPGDPFSPDGHWLMTEKRPQEGSDILVLHDLSQDSAQELKLVGVPLPQALTYSPDGQRLAVVLDGGAVEIWDLRSTNPYIARHPVPKVAGEARDVAFSPDGLWLAAAVEGNSGDAEVWRIDPTGAPGEPRLLQSCKGKTRIAVSEKGAWIYTWGGDASTNHNFSCLWSGDPKPANLPHATTAAFSSDGRWLTWGEMDGTVRLRDLQDDLQEPGRPEIPLAGPGDKVGLLLYAAGGRWLVTQEGEEAPRLCDLHRYSAGDILAATPDGIRFVVGPFAKPPRSLSPGDTAPRELQGAEPMISNWTFSPDGSWLVAGGHAGIKLWSTAANSAPQKPDIPGPASAFAFDPEGRFLAIGKVTEAWLWDPHDMSQRKVTADPNQAVASLAFDQVHHRLAVGWTQGRIGVFPTETEGILDAPQPRKSAVTALAFSPDGQWLAMAEENGMPSLWNSKREIPLGGQDKQIRTLVFSRDGRQIASGGQDGTIQVWSFDGEKIPGVPVVWKGHDGKIRALSFTADGKQLISTGAHDTVRRWPLNTADLIRFACEKAGRPLTQDEWESNAPQGERFEKGVPCPEFERK